MEINLTNKMKTLEDGAINNISFNEYDIYNAERSASTNVRLMCNVNVICDGSLFNPISEIVKKTQSDNGHLKTPLMGIENIDNNTKSEDVKIGSDIFNLPSVRAKKQPFIENQNNTRTNFTIKNSHFVKTVRDYWFRSHISSFTNISSTLSKFKRNEYASLGETFKNKLIREDSWFGFKNPVSMRYSENILPDYLNNVGVLKEKPGQFIELYPNKELYSYVPIYSQINKRLEYNWITYLTYPAKNAYDSEYLVKISDNGVNTNLKRYGLKIWFVDESDEEITLFRTTLKNGFSVGDIVSIYSGTSTANIDATCVVRAYEVVDKIDDYTFALNMGNKKLLQWNIGNADTTDFSDTVIRYSNNDGMLTRYVISSDTSVLKTDTAPYHNNLAVVRVDNQAECLYYIRVLKPFSNKPNITQNAFSKNAFGMNSASVLFIDDIDISAYKDNLNRPLTDIFLTSIKNNKGYGQWYSYKGVKQNITAQTIEECAEAGMPIEESRAFGEINGSFMMDDEVCYSADTSHKNSIRNIANTEGRTILTERDGIVDAECETLEFYGDLCEYSINSFKERSLESFMHRFNTAQRESYNCTNAYNIKAAMFGKANQIEFFNGNNTPTRYGSLINSVYTIKSNYISGATNGYYYQPHHKIRVRTYALDLSSKNAEKYRVLEIIKSGTNEFTYDTMTHSGYSCTLSIENIESLVLNEPLVLYFQHNSYDIEKDYMFNGKMYNRHNETLYDFMLDDKTLRTRFEMCIDKFDSKEYKLFVIKKPSDIPSQATILKDRSFSYIWRELMPNGFDQDSSIEEYPFANNAFYIERNINLYLRRQRDIHYNSDDEEIVKTGNDYNYEPESEKIDEINTMPSAKNYENQIKEIEEC